MNVRLLRKIAKVIQEKPRQFGMKDWHFARATKGGFSTRTSALCNLPSEKQVSCGTTHCIAGWAQVLSPERDCKASAREDAQRLLGIDEKQANRLFYASYWPKGYRGWNATAASAAARIEHFIATDGRE